MKNNIVITAAVCIGLLVTPVSAHAVAAGPANADIPSKIIIPEAKIDSPVIPLGKDKNGYMDSPEDTKTVGWYKYGARPGDPGNTVLDGHLDSDTEKGVFYRLRELRKGDMIYIEDKEEVLRSFVVTDSKVYDAYDFPMRELLAPSDTSVIHLITCYGEFDRFRYVYMERLVVSAEMVE